MALSADKTFKTRLRGRSAYKAGGTIYAGSLVVVDSTSGLLEALTDAANKQFIGIALEGAESGEDCRVDDSGVILRHVNVTGSDQTDVNVAIWPTDDDPDTLKVDDTSTTIDAIGRVTYFHSGDDCDVELQTPQEHLLQPA